MKIERLPRMLLSTQGRFSSGKTLFAVKDTPRPVTMLDFDLNVEGIDGNRPETVDGVDRKVFDIYSPAAQGASEGEVRAHMTREIARFFEEFRKAIREKTRTLVVDTFTSAWVAQRIAKKDSTYEEQAEEFRSLIRTARHSPHTNIILIHHMRQDWVRNKAGKSYPGDTYSRDGVDKVDELVQLSIEQSYTPAVGSIPAKFEMKILKCFDNQALVGQTFPAMSFVELCTMACPSIDWSK